MFLHTVRNKRYRVLEYRGRLVMTRKKGLGKGLGALLDSAEIQLAEEKERVYDLDINDISPQEDQPRKVFDQEALDELAESIRKEGVLQPIIVRKNKDRDYTIIAGERRWRASRLAGQETIPAIIRDIDDDTLLRHALIENIQREDLNPIEEALAYSKLLEIYDWTQEELAETLAKSRSGVANRLRLLKLAPEVQDFIISGEISEGHAKVLLALPQDEQIELADKIISSGLNVRETEQYIKQLKTPKEEKTENLDPQYVISIKTVEDKLSKGLGVKVKLKDKAGRGKIEIPYKNLDELDRLIELLAQDIE